MPENLTETVDPGQTASSWWFALKSRGSRRSTETWPSRQIWLGLQWWLGETDPACSLRFQPGEQWRHSRIAGKSRRSRNRDLRDCLGLWHLSHFASI
jgi:hypothetical protein